MPSSTDADGWRVVGQAAAWPTEGGVAVRVDTLRIAIFRHAGTWHAVDARCPHERVGLANGRLRDGCVACPGHGWTFDLASGAVVLGPAGMRLACYEVRESEGDVQVRLSAS